MYMCTMFPAHQLILFCRLDTTAEEAAAQHQLVAPDIFDHPDRRGPLLCAAHSGEMGERGV